MRAFRLEIRLEDFLFYATREMGRLFETEKYLHNYALTYALGLVPDVPNSTLEGGNRPRYREDLEVLNTAGIYVTPARPVQWAYALHTFKFGFESYRPRPDRIMSGKPEFRPATNRPDFGRLKELAPESLFEAFLVAEQAPHPPRWIRLGKWSSKAEVICTEVPLRTREGEFVCAHPLNPLDLPAPPRSYDVISMPPVSLVHNARLTGRYYHLKDEVVDVNLPAGMRYTFPT